MSDEIPEEDEGFRCPHCNSKDVDVQELTEESYVAYCNGCENYI